MRRHAGALLTVEHDPRSDPMTDKPWKDMTPDEKRAGASTSGATRACRSRRPKPRPTTKPASTASSRRSSCGSPTGCPSASASATGRACSAGMTPVRSHDRSGAGRPGLDRLQPQVSARRHGAAPARAATPPQMLEALDYRLYSWPGHGVANDASFQYNEKEWMLADEYDELIADPWDFMLRTYLPRTVGAFAGFGRHLVAVRLHRTAVRRRATCWPGALRR